MGMVGVFTLWKWQTLEIRASFPRALLVKHLPGYHCPQVPVRKNHRKLKCFTNSPKKSRQESKMKSKKAVHGAREKELKDALS